MDPCAATDAGGSHLPLPCIPPPPGKRWSHRALLPHSPPLAGSTTHTAGCHSAQSSWQRIQGCDSPCAEGVSWSWQREASGRDAASVPSGRGAAPDPILGASKRACLPVIHPLNAATPQTMPIPQAATNRLPSEGQRPPAAPDLFGDGPARGLLDAKPVFDLALQLGAGFAGGRVPELGGERRRLPRQACSAGTGIPHGVGACRLGRGGRAAVAFPRSPLRRFCDGHAVCRGGSTRGTRAWHRGGVRARGAQAAVRLPCACVACVGRGRGLRAVQQAQDSAPCTSVRC